MSNPQDAALPTGAEPDASPPRGLPVSDDPRSPLRIGNVVEARYRIVKLVGIGGQGVVYQAVDTQLHDSPVAIKLLLLASGPTEGLHARFERESELVARLSHPHIVKILGRFQVSERPAIVYDWVSGRTLHALIETEPLPHLEDALELARQLTNAIAYAHKHGVCHRDIKPLNVMVDDDGHVRLLDFGLGVAGASDRITRSGGALGTYGFMAPEVLRGEIERDRWQAADVFALGVTLYAYLTGIYPFNRRSQEANMFAVLCDEPKPPSSIRSDLPPEIDAVILRMLEKEPADRYPDGGHVLEALRNAKRPWVGDGSRTTRHPERTTPALPELPFVGREAAIEVTESALRAAGAGHGRLLTIAGPPGFGKSRLVKELTLRARQRGFATFDGRAVETGGDYPYQPVTMVLRDWARRRAIETLADLDRVLADKPSLVGATGVIAGLLALAPSGARDRDQLWETFALFFAELAAERATLVVLEDMHAADQASLMLLKYLSLSLPRQRLCIAFVHRLEAGKADAFARELAAANHVDRIELEGFSAAEVEGLAGRLVENPNKKAWLTGLLLREASGHPLLINEICRLLEVQGVLVREGETFGVMSQPESVELPEGFRNVVRGRLERLEPTDRELLEVAAVIGEPFPAELVAKVANREPLPIIQALHRLKRDLRLVRTDPGGEYRFDHARVRDVIYEDLPADIQRAYHSAIVNHLVATAADERAAFVAHHLEAAGRAPESREWHQRAARHARRSFALDEAAEHLERAHAFADRDTKARLLIELGEIYQENGDLDRAAERYRELLTTGNATAEPRMSALLGLARIAGNRGDPEAGGRLFEQTFALIDETTDPTLVALAHQLRGTAHALAGSTAEAIADHEASVAHARRGDPGQLAISSYRLGGLLLEVGRLDDAKRHLHEAAQLAAQAEDSSLHARALIARAKFERAMGEFAAARITLDAALHIGETRCGRLVRTQIRNAYAGYSSLLGDFARAREKTALAVEAARASSVHLQLFAALVTKVDTCSQTADLQAGLEALAEALALAPHAGPGMRLGLTLEHGVLVATIGHRDEARSILDEVRTSGTNALLVGAASYALGMLAFEHGDPEAGPLLAAAVETWSAPGDAIFRARALAGLARLRAPADPDGASQCINSIPSAAYLSRTVEHEAAFARGAVEAARGHLAESQRLCDAAASVAREQGARINEIEIRVALADLATRQGVHDLADAQRNQAKQAVAAIAASLTAAGDRRGFQARPLFATLAR